MSDATDEIDEEYGIHETRIDLADVEGLREGFAFSGGHLRNRIVPLDGIHCPVCGGRRRVDVRLDYHSGEWLDGRPQPPALGTLRCRQCRTIATGLVYDGPTGIEGFVRWPTDAGLRTPGTPEAVAYYLDQASRSEAAGARSAATAMYRAALEQLLYEQGYTTGMLAAKITAVEKDVAANTAKKWAHDLAPDFLKVIRDLGNGSIHPNGGDIKKQDALDRDLLRHVRAMMEELLDLVYEEPTRRAARLARLQSAASIVK